MPGSLPYSSSLESTGLGLTVDDSSAPTRDGGFRVSLMKSRGSRAELERGERPLAAGFSATNHPRVDELPDGMGWSIVQPAPKPAGAANHGPRFGTGINRRRSLRLSRRVHAVQTLQTAQLTLLAP